MNERTVLLPQRAVISNFRPIPTRLLQRQCACGGNPGVDGECEECHKKRLSRQSHSATSAVSSRTVPSIVNDVLSSPGHSLDAGTRTFMEPHFGHDLSHVRVHTDAKAGESARAVNALAYTVGRDVVFGTGQYVPGTKAGMKLMAHELTHVVQQQGASASNVQKKLAIGEPDDAYEREAEAYATRVIEKQSSDAIQVKERPSIARLQRQAVAAKVDPAKVLSDTHQGCTVATTARPAAPSYATLSFRLGSFDLSGKEEREIKIDSEDEMKITDFVTDMRSRRSSENIRIDGYASTDGDEDRNWILSCERATAARRELTTKHGIPEAKFKTFAHGPTSEFGSGETESDRAKNRIATLSTISAPSPTPPPGPQPGPAPTPPTPTSFAERVKNVNLTIGTPPKIQLSHDAKLVTVTLNDYLRATGTAEVTGGPDCNKFIFGFFQICRPFNVERTIFHSLTTSTDLDVDRSAALRAPEPALDVLQPGDIWYASEVSPKCATKNSPARVSVDFSDKPGTAFVMPPPGLFITGLAWQDYFFTTFSVQHPDGTIHHLKSFYWDIHFCRKIDPPSPGHSLGTTVSTVANVKVGGVMDGAPSEPGLSLTGKRAGRTCNQIVKGTPILAPRPGTFDIGCS